MDLPECLYLAIRKEEVSKIRKILPSSVKEIYLQEKQIKNLDSYSLFKCNLEQVYKIWNSRESLGIEVRIFIFKKRGEKEGLEEITKNLPNVLSPLQKIKQKAPTVGNLKGRVIYTTKEGNKYPAKIVRIPRGYMLIEVELTSPLPLMPGDKILIIARKNKLKRKR